MKGSTENGKEDAERTQSNFRVLVTQNLPDCLATPCEINKRLLSISNRNLRAVEFTFLVLTVISKGSANHIASAYLTINTLHIYLSESGRINHRKTIKMLT